MEKWGRISSFRELYTSLDEGPEATDCRDVRDRLLDRRPSTLASSNRSIPEFFLEKRESKSDNDICITFKDFFGFL